MGALVCLVYRTRLWVVRIHKNPSVREIVTSVKRAFDNRADYQVGVRQLVRVQQSFYDGG
jgi:hypothetical protein